MTNSYHKLTLNLSLIIKKPCSFMYQKENWQGQFLYKSIPTEGERLCLIHICFFFCCQLHFVTMAIAQE